MRYVTTFLVLLGLSALAIVAPREALRSTQRPARHRRLVVVPPTPVSAPPFTTERPVVTPDPRDDYGRTIPPVGESHRVRMFALRSPSQMAADNVARREAREALRARPSASPDVLYRVLAGLERTF